MDDLVMRSVYLRPSEDSQLRQMAHELNVTKSDLIRSAISTKLKEWREANSLERVLDDLQFGRRDGVGAAAARVVVHPMPAQMPKAAPPQAQAGKPRTSARASSGAAKGKSASADAG